MDGWMDGRDGWMDGCMGGWWHWEIVSDRLRLRGKTVNIIVQLSPLDTSKPNHNPNANANALNPTPKP